jgi:HTH-type transcriptional regulator/antitoxin HigA
MAGLKQATFAEVVGSRSRASEVLNRKRPLTMDMAFRINREWHIPAEVLIQPYHLANDRGRPRRKRA